MIWHSIALNEVINKLATSIDLGLSANEAERRLSNYGYNKLEEKKKVSIAARFIRQFNDYMIIILLIASVISYLVSYLQGKADYIDSLIILAIVILNAVIGVVQESKAEKALEALKKITASKSTVMRDGQAVSINSEEIVVGDILLLKSGDFVPADARLISSIELKADESSLTGESVAVSKDCTAIYDENITLADMKNMLWASTAIVSGKATAVTVETGMDTEVGKIADMINTGESPNTPLQERLAKTGEILAKFALGLCGFIFILGVLRKIPPFEMFMTSVSLAVAAIPEGLPAVVTILLAIGVQKMAGENAIIRKLQAVETLGSANVICSDKTGTLTQNKMTVTEIYGDSNQTLTLAALCSNNTDATEKAIINAAHEHNINTQENENIFKRIYEVPFNSADKFMITVHKSQNDYRIIIKGAPDIVLEKCSISKSEKSNILNNVNKMSSKALRVIAVACRDSDFLPNKTDSNLNFVGLIGLIDPPRPEVKNAVSVCKNAGIKPVMITGDHVGTAVAIASEIGIKTENDEAITGQELDNIPDSKLLDTIQNYSVFARVTPKHKVRIVDLYQKRNCVVAMTGDGVNDAPALKKADIGCAMGITGTDVAKGAADMILTDDNFATIVEAVRLGRGIYSNIIKSIHFLLSSNIGEILTILVALLLGWQSPLIAIQLLWVNLVTDSLPAIALGFEKTDRDIMNKKPINKNKGMFADGLGGTIVLEGIMIGLLTILAFAYGSKSGDLNVGRTMAFCVLSFSQLVHAFNVRSDKSVFKVGLFSNKILLVSDIICAAMQISVVIIPALANMFKVVSLNYAEWRIVAILSFTPIFVVEAVKLLNKIPARVKKATLTNKV